MMRRMNTSPAPELTVYYDGGCPLCLREIAFYQGLRGAAALAWHDISAGAPTGPDLSCDAAMRRFHVRDVQGRLYSGAAGFARLWRGLGGGWRVLGWLAGTPPVVWLLELAYRAFLPLRPHLQRWALARAKDTAT